jgi:hypothetical protein
MRLSFAVLFAFLLACGGSKPRAEPPPAGCENDPKCAARQRVFDCSKQCSDDPACVDRCREMNVSSGQTDR